MALYPATALGSARKSISAFAAIGCSDTYGAPATYTRSGLRNSAGRGPTLGCGLKCRPSVEVGFGRFVEGGAGLEGCCAAQIAGTSIVVRAPAMHRAAVIPDHEIANLPFMAVG